MKKHHIFIWAALFTIIAAVLLDYFSPEVELFSAEYVPDLNSPSTFTEYKLPLNEFTKADIKSAPMPVLGAGNVWSNYNRDDWGVFTYSPYTPQNEQNEDVLHFGDDHRQAELRAIFQKKYCFNGQMKLTDPKTNQTIGGPSPVDAVDLKILSKLRFPEDRQKCNPCSEKCEFSIMDSDRKLATEEFLVRPKGTNTEEMYARLEQAWTRVFHGVREIFI